LEEGFGLTVVEAAACGAAVICSNVSALPEVLDEPAATFDPGDPRDLAGAIAKALSDDDHRAVLREAGRRAVERWRWDRVATDMLAAIAEFGDPPPPPREPRRRVAVVTRCAGSDWERDVETDVVRSLRETAEADIVELVDTAGTSAVVQPDPAGATWPAAALGRYVKYHEFDHVVALIDRWDSHAVAVRIARQYPVHVWLCGSVEAQVPPDIRPRSMIVESLPEAEAVRQTATAPVLVLPSSTSTSGWSAADTARALDHWLTVGHRTDETITVVGPADTLM
jgi:hypothetical protein